MNDYNPVIAPFVYLIRQIFLFSYDLTGNYGTSVVLLSFTISLLLLPIFILIEKAKKKDDAVKQKMKPQADEIKRCYKGQERYYYLRTLNRQYNYHPVRALIPTLSLLLQIPFFIAAYQYLEHFEPLRGVGFLFIHDLSAPDGLMGSINILPVIMTVVNLITAFFYTRNGNASERIQMLVVAGIFLVLLFNLPSGLVLYWTMNNVFSFFRLFITNPEVFKRRKKSEKKRAFSINDLKLQLGPLLPRIKLVFIFLTTIILLTQFIWAFQNSFNDFHIRLIGSLISSLILTILVILIILLYNRYKEFILKIRIQPGIFFSLLFLALYFYLAAQYYFTGINTSLQIIAFLFLLPLQIFAFIYVIRVMSSNPSVFFRIVFFLVLFVFIAQVLILINYVSNKPILLKMLYSVIEVRDGTPSDIIQSGILSSILAIPFYLHHNKIKITIPVTSDWLIYVLSIVYITGLIFLWYPLQVYSSSPQTFDFAAIMVLKNNYKLALLVLLITIVFYVILPKKVKGIWVFIILLLTAISFINSSVIPLKLGSLQVSRFSEQEKLAAPVLYYILEAFLLIALYSGIQWLYRRQKIKFIIWILLVMNVFLVGHSTYKTYKTGYFFQTGREITSASEISKIPFSKDKQNILYFLADGFQGWFIDQIMEEDPELKIVFEGFTWYPNTLSTSNYTHSSLPALMGGHEHTVKQMNKDTTHTIQEKISKISEEFCHKIRSEGYTLASSDMHYSGIDKSNFDYFIPKWDNNWKKFEKNVPMETEFGIWYSRLYENAIFYAVPLFLKPRIYNNTDWLANQKQKKEKKSSFKDYNFIRLLPYISTTDTDHASFIYIHEHSLHNPWNIVTDKGKMISDVTPYENHRWFIKNIAKWITWMKENEVYDNTRIVFVSDHGPTWDMCDEKPDFESPVKWDEDDPDKIHPNFYWRLTALLLTKDFNAKGVLKQDWRLMSNVDAPAILFDENNPAKQDSISRTLTTYFTLWASHMIYQKTMEIKWQFDVTDNIYDLKNWKETTDER